MRIKILIACMAALSLLSCSTNKENTLSYFKDLAGSPSGVLPKSAAETYSLKVQADDELIITVSSLVPEATAAYNMPLGNPANRGTYGSQSQPRLQTYIVDESGSVTMPVIGKVQVAGKTTTQIANDITARVSHDVKDPVVRVELLNYGVDVMGEVKNPHRVIASKQRYTVLDALSDCGDLTEYGKRDGVLVIREENGVKTYHRLDMSDSNVFGSPYFYLQQNDVVYVEPNEIKIDNSKYNQNSAYKLTVISTIVSAASVIASLVIALTVK